MAAVKEFNTAVKLSGVAALPSPGNTGELNVKDGKLHVDDGTVQVPLPAEWTDATKGHRIFVGTAAPSSPATNDVWIRPGVSGSSPVSAEVEIDFGSTPVVTKSFTVTDAAVSTGSKIMVSPSGNTATGRVGNDYEWEAFSFSAVPGSGSFVLSAVCANGSVVGKRKVIYLVI